VNIVHKQDNRCSVAGPAFRKRVPFNNPLRELLDSQAPPRADACPALPGHA
jgi:hypothetical protein